MKKLLTATICLFFLVPSLTYSDEEKWDPIGTYKSGLETENYLEPDKWEPDRINIKSGRETEGYIKRDQWESDRFNFYDKSGKPTGIYLKQDRWQPDRYNIKKDPLSF
ncbi:MAG: hypothetical protein JRE61_11415 [Deltaproteobacteria bacterium]|nr:hypothetical protein [Deltaproteobacteria bacterium]